MMESDQHQTKQNKTKRMIITKQLKNEMKE